MGVQLSIVWVPFRIFFPPAKKITTIFLLMGKTQTKIPYKQIGSNLEIQLLEELRSWKGRASGINQKLR